MIRVAQIRDGQIANVILRREGDALLDGEMLESDAIAAGIPVFQREQSGRKIWQTVAEFWGEFSAEEQLAIMDHEHPGIRLLLEALRMWRGEVWGDDERVTQGLGALVSLGVISEQRREEILAG